jgi:hypothetical protein
MTKQRMSPEDAQKAADHALQHVACDACAAGPGEPCVRPGPGRSAHKDRFVAAAIELRQQARAARRTPEQAALLAGLPRVSPEEVEAARSPRGGWTRATLAAWDVPWPPPAGWRRALERGEEVSG